MIRNFEQIVQRFQEHDPVFNSVSRAKIDSLTKSENPAPGTYNPRSDTFKRVTASAAQSPKHKQSMLSSPKNSLKISFAESPEPQSQFEGLGRERIRS